jgi:hypothetical protein
VVLAALVKVAYGCCVGSWDRFQRNVVPAAGDYERPLMALSGQSSIAEAYNTILEAFFFSGQRDLDALVLLHDDLEITDPQAEEKILAAVAEPDVALVGVAGATLIHGLNWWDAFDTVGHQLTDSMMIDFGPREGDVVSLEGSILAFSPWAIKNLRFDTQFPGFHGYDEISMQAINEGKRVVVRDIDTHHHTKVGFASTQSQEQWLLCNELFRKKWGLA